MSNLVLQKEATGAERDVTSAYWDGMKGGAVPRRYWQFSQCIASLNRRLGHNSIIWGGALISMLKASIGERVLHRGISIGCGAGSKELPLLKAGIVERFDLVEISQARIAQGRALFDKAGLLNRVAFKAEDGLVALADGRASFDLVYWDNALHHMSDVRRSLELSLLALRPGGFIVINEYVGPNRFQYSASDLNHANAVRALLPDRFFKRSAWRPP